MKEKTLAQSGQKQLYLDRLVATLRKVKTYQDVLDFLYRELPSRLLCRRQHANLSVLVHTQSVPADVTLKELDIYLQLVRRWKSHSLDLFEPGTLDRLEQSLVEQIHDIEEKEIERFS